MCWTCDFFFCITVFKCSEVSRVMSIQSLFFLYLDRRQEILLNKIVLRFTLQMVSQIFKGRESCVVVVLPRY